MKWIWQQRLAACYEALAAGGGQADYDVGIRLQIQRLVALQRELQEDVRAFTTLDVAFLTAYLWKSSAIPSRLPAAAADYAFAAKSVHRQDLPYSEPLGGVGGRAALFDRRDQRIPSLPKLQG